MIVHGGEPFFLPGGKHGILLIHGFTAVPAEMLLLGQYLHAHGYTVLGVRVAGHGTTPTHLARITYKGWYNSVCDGYSILSGCCEQISAVGQSMGGLLALRLAANAELANVVSLAAPIMIHEDKKLFLLPAREECVGRFKPKRRRNMPNVPEICNISYGEMPLVSVHELLDLIENVKKELPKIHCPALVVQSYNDHTVRYRSANYIYKRIGSLDKDIFWLDRSGHLLTLDCQREQVFARIKEFLDQRGGIM